MLCAEIGLLSDKLAHDKMISKSDMLTDDVAPATHIASSHCFYWTWS